MTSLYVVAPEGIDDPARPSGGNHYDRRVCDGLRALGWDVREVPVAGPWPEPDAEALSALTGRLAALPDDGLVVVDGLIASCAPTALVPEAARLRVVVLVHMPLGDRLDAAAEQAVLTRARAVVTTSGWTRAWLLDRYRLAPDVVHVAHPGVDLLDPAEVSPDGRRLLCVAALAPHKGQDVLLEALAGVPAPEWRCTLVGSPDRDPAFTARLRQKAAERGLAGRVRFAGACAPDRMHRHYRAADLVVLPSHGETYGMVVTEALAAGLPVLATAVGGVPEALGSTEDGAPGMLVPPGDPAALGAALRAWLGSAPLRHRLRRAASLRRGTLAGWDATTGRIASALTAVRDEPPGARVRVSV